MEAESGAQNEEARIDESTQTSLDELEDDVPDFDENDPSFRDFQNLVDFSAVSKHQKWIILLRTQGLSYRQICDNWKSHVGSLLSKEALINCIHRFAKSLYFFPTACTRTRPYMSFEQKRQFLRGRHVLYYLLFVSLPYCHFAFYMFLLRYHKKLKTQMGLVNCTN